MYSLQRGSRKVPYAPGRPCARRYSLPGSHDYFLEKFSAVFRCVVHGASFSEIGVLPPGKVIAAKQEVLVRGLAPRLFSPRRPLKELHYVLLYTKRSEASMNGLYSYIDSVAE